MVLADGTVVRASPTEHADLFYGTAGAFGTLGIITAAEVQLIPAKQYVTTTYFPVESFQNAVETIQKKIAEEEYDYIDGIMFGSDHGVIIAGKLSDMAEGKLVRFSRAHDPWYYLHAQSIDSQKKIITEATPLTDYLFRYDRGAFWVGSYAFGLFDIPFNAFTRWLLNPILHTRKLYQALQESGASQQYVVQDLALPLDQAEEFMQFVDKRLGVYPLWLCPLKPDSKSPLQSNNLDTPMVINVGVWGDRVKQHATFVKANRAIETKLKELGGKKWFYAHSYYTKQEFWQIYDEKRYAALRRKYHATTLPTVFDKIRVKDTYEVNFKRGLYRTIFGRAKIRIKD
jgi:FAD/FMN-containing dehydrogenase